MRATTYAWWCSRGHKNGGGDKSCGQCGVNRRERHAQVHASERAVVYYNPATGEHRTPPRTDMPIPRRYAQDGFERKEIMSMVEWEKQSGCVHEPTNFNNGNELPSIDPAPIKVNQEVKKALVQDMAAAFASGPWTGAEKLV